MRTLSLPELMIWLNQPDLEKPQITKDGVTVQVNANVVSAVMGMDTTAKAMFPVHSGPNFEGYTIVERKAGAFTCQYQGEFA